MSDCNIICHQNKGKFFDKLNGEGEGLGSNKKPIARLGRNYGLSYEDMLKLIPYEPIRMVADAREFLEVMRVKKPIKLLDC